MFNSLCNAIVMQATYNVMLNKRRSWTRGRFLEKIVDEMRDEDICREFEIKTLYDMMIFLAEDELF